LAGRYLRQEKAGGMLQPTALVNELFLVLFRGEPVDWQNRAHFFAVAARQMRHLLIDRARAQRTDKRGGRMVKVSISDVDALSASPRSETENLLALDQALTRLEQLEPRVAKVIELRFFGGLTEAEACEVLDISLATLKRDWTFGRAWLANELGPGQPKG
jgi:RNA polymerase sigma factor (TIGR02999 family)